MYKISFFLFLIPHLINAGNPVIDSLKVAANQATSIEEKVNITRNIGFEFYDSQIQYDSAYFYAKKAHTIAVENNLELEQAQTLFDQGMVLAQVGNVEDAISDYLKSINHSINAEAHFGTAAAYNNIAILYTAQKDFDIAKEYHRKSLNVAQGNDIHIFKATNTINIGDIEYQQGQFEESLATILESIKIYESFTEVPSEAYLSLAKVKDTLQRTEEAIIDANTGLKLALKENLFESIYEHAAILARLHEKSSNYKEAIRYHKLTKSYNDSIVTLEELNEVEKVMLKAKLKEQHNALVNLEEKTKYLTTIYILAAIGIFLLITLVLRQRKITRMTKNIHDIQNSLIKTELDRRTQKTSTFEATVNGDREFLRM